ncbi:Ribosomal RNA small subunit methyltransferase E [Gammaproteobacteria bacterium MOLA455]|nr:Ribosomal RNA small subunit methyltransferase E [Gammaproteobacteria bacterium MOLA455]
MRIPRIFTDQPLSSGAKLALTGSAARHLFSALRMSVGQEITLFNGLGGEFSATLTTTAKSQVDVSVGDCREIDRESPLKLHLVIAVSRGERMDWIMQKATELGVTEITPLFSERTEVKLNRERLEKKLRHWQQVSISACEQCQRNRVPTINNALTLDQWLSQSHEDPEQLKLVLHHRSDKTLAQHQPPENVCLLVGPEGGLSDSEIKRAIDRGFAALTLGPRVMRTETAPLAAISIMQSLWGDMG